ncbi:methionine ABC transporter ATP-binding protein [Halomonas sp. AOP5-B2-8]
MNIAVAPYRKIAPSGAAYSQKTSPRPPLHLRLEGVSKTYVSGQRRVEALKDINLDIYQGEIFGIIGRSGAGKSSLIRTLNRLEDATTGKVLINGVDIQSLDTGGLVILRRRIGMIFQHFNLLSSATVFENLALPLKAAGIRDKKRIRQRAQELLRLVGLEGKEDVYPSRLSGGQKQRVGIARALMLDPEILLCDEATSALDPETTQSILSLIKEINKTLKLTVVLITHEMSVISQICDRVAVLEDGALAELGPVWRVFGRPEHEATQALLAPLKPKVADDIAQAISATPANSTSRAIVKLFFDGTAATYLPLGILSQRLGGDLRLLQSGIGRLQGHPQGELLVSLPYQQHELAQRLETINDLISTVEVLGYAVPANA